MTESADRSRKRVPKGADHILSVASVQIAVHAPKVARAAGDTAQSAALWSVSKYGRAGTGAAIKSLHGAPATRAALARLGGGPAAMGGGGMAGGLDFLKSLGTGTKFFVGGAAISIAAALLLLRVLSNQPEQDRLEAILEEFGAIPSEGLRAMGEAHPSVDTRNGRWLVRMADELDGRGQETLADLPREVFDEIARYSDSDGADE